MTFSVNYKFALLIKENCKVNIFIFAPHTYAAKWSQKKKTETESVYNVYKFIPKVIILNTSFTIAM